MPTSLPLVSSQNHPNENNPKALFLLGKHHYEKYTLSYEADDFRTAKNHLESLAEQDNADAQFLLGMLYKAKQGSHSKEAIHWFLKAEQNGVQNATHELNQFHYIKEKAENGCAESLFQLGEYYEFQGFYSLAMEYWEEAAHQGCVLAQNKLYDFHKNNHNYIESEHWHKQLTQNEKDKQIELGIAYYHEKEYDQAVYWLKKAVTQDAIPLGDCYYSLEKANLLSEIGHWLEQLATEDNPKVINALTQCYKETNSPKYVDWLQELITKGNRDAYFQLGAYYSEQREWKNAIHWLEQWAEPNNTDDYLYIAKWAYQKSYWEEAVHWFGKIAETDSEKPIDTQGMCKWKENSYRFFYEWEKKWNEKSHIRAIDIIEEMYYFQDYYGVHCLSIYDDVFNKWFIKLAELGNDAEEQYDVAKYYYYWKDDCEKAIEWYEKSAEQGYYRAQYSLGRLLFEEEKDLNQAIYWLYQADLQEDENEIPLEAHPKSLKNLTQESWDILLHWYRAFSEKGDYFGQLHLGICYNEGLGVEKDTEKALFWLKKSFEHECIETFRYLEETKILDFENPYYEQIRKVEDAQPIKRVFMQEWLSANKELFNTINNEKFEMQFWTNVRPSPIKENQVDYVFFLIFRTFEFLTKYSSEEYATILDEYRSIMETKKKIWVYSPFYRKNIKIPENSEELFKWIFKTDVFSTSPVAIWYPEIRIPDAYQKYIGKSLHLYKPDFKEVIAFDRRKMIFGQLDEFKAYQKSINEQLPSQVLYEQIRRKSV